MVMVMRPEIGVVLPALLWLSVIGLGLIVYMQLPERRALVRRFVGAVLVALVISVALWAADDAGIIFTHPCYQLERWSWEWIALFCYLMP